MADKRADQLKEITERLEQGVKDIFTSEMYTKYLLTMSKFHNYSFNNTLLIAMQRPDATLVAGYNAWKNKFNRYVKKGEKGIQIIAPAPVKEREEREKIDKDTGLTVLNESGEPEIEVVERVIPRFRVTTVFDYAQTDGEPLPTLEVNELTARVKDYTLLKEAIEQVSPVPIRFGEIEGNAKGYYSHMERMGYILAYTLNYNNHDGRYSHSNKEWADTTCKGERGNNIRPDWIVRSHPAVLNGFVDMYRKELEAEQQREPEKPFVQQFYVVTDLQTNPMQIEKFGDLDDAMSCYQQVPNFHLKALGVEKTPDPLPGSLDIVQCKNGIDTIVEDCKKVPGWDNPYIQNHVVALVAEALKVQDVAVAYEINDGYFHIQTSEDGYDYTLYSKDFTVMDGGIVETDEYRPVQEVMEEVLAEHGHSVSECGVISAEYLQEQSYRAETQRAEAMKEKLAAEKPAPEASISFYVAECAEFPVMGEFHDNLTLEQALEVYDKIPAERMKGIKSIGFSLEDGSIYSGMFDLMVGGEVQAEIVNHIQHYRESPMVQKAISDMKTLLEKRQASKELEERPSTRQSVREALKNRKKAQEQQSNQEQEKPKKAKKKGEMEL